MIYEYGWPQSGGEKYTEYEDFSEIEVSGRVDSSIPEKAAEKVIRECMNDLDYDPSDPLLAVDYFVPIRPVSGKWSIAKVRLAWVPSIVTMNIE